MFLLVIGSVWKQKEYGICCVENLLDVILFMESFLIENMFVVGIFGSGMCKWTISAKVWMNLVFYLAHLDFEGASLEPKVNKYLYFPLTSRLLLIPSQNIGLK